MGRGGGILVKNKAQQIPKQSNRYNPYQANKLRNVENIQASKLDRINGGKDMTATELKCQVEQGFDRHFFTRETMRFFGDTMRNYGVRHGGDISGIKVWELYRKQPVKHGIQSSAYFDKETYKRVFK